MGIISKYTDNVKDLRLEKVYYRIIKIEYSVVNPETLTVIVDCFTSKEARDKELQPFERRVFMAKPEEFGVLFDKDKLFKMAYKFIKSYDDLKNGTDE